MLAPNTHNYVAGFMFDNLRQRVVLIRKKPKRAGMAWQTGLLNGLGGGIEPTDPSPADAMAREFNEEAFGEAGKVRGFQTEPEEWQHFCRMSDHDTWSVEFFACIGDPNFLRFIEETGGAEDEPVEIISLDAIHPNSAGMIENLPWLIALALDFLADGRPGFVTVNYPAPKLATA